MKKLYLTEKRVCSEVINMDRRTCNISKLEVAEEEIHILWKGSVLRYSLLMRNVIK